MARAGENRHARLRLHFCAAFRVQKNAPCLIAGDSFVWSGFVKG